MSLAKPEKRVVFVDVEALLDMRQGYMVYKGMSYDEVMEVISSGDYNVREYDDFGGEGCEKYREAISKGEKEIIKNSTVTYIINTINISIDTIINMGSAEGRSFEPEVWVNLRNFELNDIEQKYFKNSLFVSTFKRCVIRLFNMDFDEITPLFIRDNNIVSVFMYDGADWLNPHMETLMGGVPLNETQFYFAPIYRIYDEVRLESLKEKTGFESVFGFMEFSLSEHTNCKHLPIMFYSNYPIAKKCQDIYMDSIREEREDIEEKYEDKIEEFLDEHFGESL